MRICSGDPRTRVQTGATRLREETGSSSQNTDSGMREACLSVCPRQEGLSCPFVSGQLAQLSCWLVLPPAATPIFNILTSAPSFSSRLLLFLLNRFAKEAQQLKKVAVGNLSALWGAAVNGATPSALKWRRANLVKAPILLNGQSIWQSDFVVGCCSARLVKAGDAESRQY